MQKWEYTTLDLDGSLFDRQIANLGKQGWELVAVNETKAFFKRAIQ
jgi:hypothetical protein